jgi:hypothetical protein
LFPLRANSGDGKTFVVRLDYSIERGKLGIGCIRADGLSYVGEGERIASSDDSRLDLTFDRGDGAAWLVIRNVAADGEPSVLRLHGIRTFTAEPSGAVQV